MNGMKRSALVASVGLGLAVVVAAQALKTPEREPVAPIELPRPVARSDDERAKEPAGRTTTRDRKSSRPAATGPRPGPPARSPHAQGPADNDGADDRDPGPAQPAPPPPPGASDAPVDSALDDDLGDLDGGGDDGGDDDDSGD